MRVCSFDIGTKNFAFVIIGEFLIEPIVVKADISGIAGNQVELRMNLMKILEAHMQEFISVDVFLIEQQYYSTRNGKANLICIRLAEVVYSWLIDQFGNYRVIQYYPSRSKYSVLQAPKGMNYRTRKNWSIQKCIELGYSNTLEKYEKQDDISDCILIIEAFLKQNKRL